MFSSVRTALDFVSHFFKGGLGGIFTQAAFEAAPPQSPFVKGGRLTHQN